MATENAARLAVLIDADNAQASIIEALLAEVAKYGTAHVKRAYGDWTSTNLRGWKDQPLAQSIQQFVRYRGPGERAIAPAARHGHWQRWRCPLLSWPTPSALSAGVKDPEPTGFRRIPVGDLDWCPGPLPDADARLAGELDLPAGSLDRDVLPGVGHAPAVPAVAAQHVGEDGDRVVALEGDEGGCFGQPVAEGRLDSCAEQAEAPGQVAQERD